ncbi:MAG: peroxiredoxin [Myxococcota bacterium]|nr:peroxiredoxin [Myxococcota bacterium]
MTVTVGDRAPNFTLLSTSGEAVTLSAFVGQRTVVLFFYPKDDTPGCTAEACAFRDRYESFVAAGAEVIGVSSDSARSHDRFATKHKLPMTLVSDPDGAVRSLYGVRPTLGIFPGRATFVIDRGGMVRHVFVSQLRTGAHVDKALAEVRKLEKSPRSEAG